MKKYSFIDLFAGCGGLTRGFEDSGRFESTFAVESDRDAAHTYRANFGDHVRQAAIEDVVAYPNADVVVGGPPCQGFSPLNRAAVGFERRGLWREYLRALELAAPKMFLMENVPQLLKTSEYQRFCSEARRLGYQVEGQVLNAADFGVPQTRRRAIVIGSMTGAITWPSATHGPVHDPNLLTTQRWRTFREATAGLPLVPDGKNWHRARNPQAISITRYQAVPHDGGSRFEMQANLDRAGLGDLVPPCWRKKPTGTTDVFGRLWWDRPASTIRTEFFKPEKGRYLHPEQDRPITVREAARCMSFPDDLVLPEDQSMTSIARQVGNAVPCRLAQALAEVVAGALDAKPSADARRSSSSIAA